MNDSGEFQEVESNYGGNSCHVPSQPAIIPSPQSMLSRDRSMPVDTWNLIKELFTLRIQVPHVRFQCR